MDTLLIKQVATSVKQPCYRARYEINGSISEPPLELSQRVQVALDQQTQGSMRF